MRTEDDVTDNPGYYGELASFLLQLYKLTDEGKYKNAVLKFAEKIYNDLTEFLLKIQINDSDSHFNGGWMRAFDMDHNEYYGLNKDKDWGAYCIMAGWVTGFIPLVFLSELDKESIFI